MGQTTLTMQKPPIYIIESKDRQYLADMFMRFQEYYESPEFKGRVFSIEEFAHWYSGKYGSFSYSRDWYGFNIPSKVLEPFRQGEFNPLTVQEKKLLNLCKNATGDFYVVGVTPKAEYFIETLKHEFVHGAFHVNPEYRAEVTSCVKDHKIKEIDHGLGKMGYHTDVFADETNAYVLVEPETIQDFVSIRNTQNLRSKLDTIFKKYFGYSILEAKAPTLLARAEHVSI